MSSHALGAVYASVIQLCAALFCALAWWRGGAPERIGTTLTLVGWLLASTLQLAIGSGKPSLGLVSIPFLLIDFALSFGFLLLALRYASLWLGVAMLAQGAQLAMHALFIAQGGHHAVSYARWSNVASGVLLLALLFGVAAAWRRRGRPAPPDPYAIDPEPREP